MPTESEQFADRVKGEAGALNYALKQYNKVQEASEEALKNCITNPVAAAGIIASVPGQIAMLDKLIEAYKQKYPALVPGLRDTKARLIYAAESAAKYLKIPEAQRQVKSYANALYNAIA